MNAKSKTLEYWREYYHTHKHDPAVVARRRLKEKNRRKHVRDHSPFKRLSKYHRKRNGADVYAIDLWKMCLRQRCRCPLTGRKLTIENMSVDHVVPLVKGGTSKVENLRLVVKEANIAKHVMSDVELVELCKDIVSMHI